MILRSTDGAQFALTPSRQDRRASDMGEMVLRSTLRRPGIIDRTMNALILPPRTWGCVDRPAARGRGVERLYDLPPWTQPGRREDRVEERAATSEPSGPLLVPLQRRPDGSGSRQSSRRGHFIDLPGMIQ